MGCRTDSYHSTCTSQGKFSLYFPTKVKLLVKELEQVKATQGTAVSETQKAEGSQRELETKLKHKDWEMQDLAAIKDAK